MDFMWQVLLIQKSPICSLSVSFIMLATGFAFVILYVITLSRNASYMFSKSTTLFVYTLGDSIVSFKEYWLSRYFLIQGTGIIDSDVISPFMRKISPAHSCLDSW